MYDISAANIVQVVIDFDNGFPLTFEQEDFSADTPPIRISARGIANTRIDMNGNLLKRRNRQPVRVELSPIPNTQTDAHLKQMLLDARKDSPFADDARVISEMTIKLDSFGEYLKLIDGYAVDGGIGIEVVAEGRFASQPYIFEFADIEGTIHAAAFRGDYVAPQTAGEEGESGGGESGGNASDKKEKNRKRKYALKGTSGFTPLTTTGKQMMQPNWKTPLTTNKWFG